MTFQDELERLRREFRLVDTKSPESLRRWFDSHPHFTSHDHEIISGRNHMEVVKWRALAGLPKANNCKPPRQKRKIPNIPDPPVDWDNAEWLAQAKQKHSNEEIGLAVGLVESAIRRRLKKHGIPGGRRPNNHPCHTHRWLWKHYVESGLSLEECAALAGTDRRKMRRWLAHFEIPVRTRGENTDSIRRRIPAHSQLWTREMAYRLQQQPIVRKIRRMARGMIVRYRNGTRDIYWYDIRRTRRYAWLMTEADSRLQKVPEVHLQYPNGPGLDSIYPHLIIPPEQWDAASLLERRVAVHHFIAELRKLWWRRPIVPDEVLRADLEAIRSLSVGGHVLGDSLSSFGQSRKRNPGWDIIPHFFDLTPEMNPIWSNPRKLYYITRLLQRQGLTLSTSEVIRCACGVVSLIVPNPGLHVELLRGLKARGTVLDLHPGLGSRAIACSVLGLKYRTLPDPSSRFEAAMDCGLAEFLGLDWEHYDGGSVDVAMCDNDFRDSDLQPLLEYADRARLLVGFCTVGKLPEVESLRPNHVLKVKTHSWRSERDRYLVW